MQVCQKTPQVRDEIMRILCAATCDEIEPVFGLAVRVPSHSRQGRADRQAAS